MTTKQISEQTQDKKYLVVKGASGQIAVEVSMIDTKRVFGRTDALITPVSGSGEMWVSVDSLVSEVSK